MDLPGYGDPATWPACTGHPNDPRTPEGPERLSWEEDNAYTDVLDSSAINEVLYELLYGDPAIAKADLEKAVESEFQDYLKTQAEQDAQDAASACAEAREWWAA